MKVLSTDGFVWIDIADSEEADYVASHWSCVREYLRTRDPSALGHIESQTIAGYEFETDPGEIDFWHASGLLDFRNLVERDHGI